MGEAPTIAQLWTAAHVCDACGCAWGSPLTARPATSDGTCHLCGTRGPVAHVRSYGYLRRGLALVEGQNRQATTTDTP